MNSWWGETWDATRDALKKFSSGLASRQVDLASSSPLERNRYALIALGLGLIVGFAFYVQVIEGYYKNYERALAEQTGGIEKLSNMEEFALKSAPLTWSDGGSERTRSAELAVIAARVMEALGIDRPRSYSDYYVYPSFRTEPADLLGFDLVANRVVSAWHEYAADQRAIAPGGPALTVAEISPMDQFLYLLFDDYRTDTGSHCRLANTIVLKRIVSTAIANPPIELPEGVSARRWLVNRLNQADSRETCLGAAMIEAADAFYGVDLTSYQSGTMDAERVRQLHKVLFPEGKSIIPGSKLNVEVFKKVWAWFEDDDVPSVPNLKIAQVYSAILSYYGMSGSVGVATDVLERPLERAQYIRKSLGGAGSTGFISALDRMSTKEPGSGNTIKNVSGIDAGAWDEAGRAHMTLMRNSFLIGPTQGGAASAKDTLNRFKGWEQACIIMSFFAGLAILLQRMIGLIAERNQLSDGIRENTEKALSDIRGYRGVAQVEKDIDKNLRELFDADGNDRDARDGVNVVIRMLHHGREDTQRERRKDEFLSLLDAQEYGLERSHAWLNLMIMLVPTFAFIGTVDGIMTAFPEAKSVISASGKIEQVAEITNVTGALGLAFATTFVGLILAMILRIGREAVSSAERRLVANCRKRFIRHYQEAVE